MKRAEIHATITGINGGDDPHLTIRIDGDDTDRAVEATLEQLSGYKFGQRVRMTLMPMREPKQ